MVSKEDILTTIDKLDEKYNMALMSESPQDATFYAKLALLEYCGWLEETLDDIVISSIHGQLTTQPFKQMFDAIVLGTHGFRYKKYFRPMLVKTMGIVRVEKFEIQIEQNGDLTIFKAELDTMAESRNIAAHTWIEGTTQVYPAPSLIQGSLRRIFPIVQIINGEISSLMNPCDC